MLELYLFARLKESSVAFHQGRFYPVCSVGCIPPNEHQPGSILIADLQPQRHGGAAFPTESHRVSPSTVPESATSGESDAPSGSAVDVSSGAGVISALPSMPFLMRQQLLQRLRCCEVAAEEEGEC